MNFKPLVNNKSLALWCAVVLMAALLIIISNDLLEEYHRVILFSGIIIIGSILFCVFTIKPCYNGIVYLIQKTQEYYYALLSRISESINRIIAAKEITDNKETVDLLSPVEDIERHKYYVERINKAINSLDARNIALTGSYGSGKSSILKTFKKCFPAYKYINVSLASFVEVNEKKKSNQSGLNYEEQLEYSILQQLFYQVKPSKIPSSRFGRIERSSLCSRILQTIMCFFLVSAISFLFLKDVLSNNIGISKELIDRDWIHWGAVSLFIFSLLFFIFKFVVTLSRVSLKNLKISEATLQLEDKKNVSIMNRYMDEILYLFQVMKYEIVIFEDIDRFDGTEIFTKLRELNLLLNQSEEIKHKVVFLYALRDDIFSSAEQRTKFFDYIVPVIPYVNVSNSADLFRRKFKALNIPESDLPSDFITNISVFVDDMRVLTNIVNEFQLYRKMLDQKLDLKKLLATTLYKNLYPTDFAKLHQNEGVVYSVFASKNLLKAERREEIKKRIYEIDSKLEAIDKEWLASEKELRQLVVFAFLKNAHPYINEFYISSPSKRISIHDLTAEENIQSILQGSLTGLNHYGNRRNVSREEMLSTLEEFDYTLRKEAIQNKRNVIVRKLQNERRNFAEQLTLLEKNTLVDLYKSGIDIFSGIDKKVFNPKSEKDFKIEDYSVLKTLLENGYIDEQYFLYISLYQEGMLTPSDQNFLMNVKFNTPLPATYKLQEVESLVLNLSIEDYDRIAIVNYDLIDYLLGNHTKNEDKCRTIVKHIVNSPKYGLDSIYEYLNIGQHPKLLVGYAVQLWPDLKNELLNNTKHDDNELYKFIQLVFAQSSIEEIASLCDSGLSRHINAVPNYNTLFKDIEKQKIESIIDAIDLRFIHLRDKDNVVTQYVVDTNHYELNIDNIWFVLESYHGIERGSYNDCIYTPVYLSSANRLKDYIADNLELFVKTIVIGRRYDKEQEKPFIELINNDSLSQETKSQLVSHNKTKIDNVNSIDNEAIKKQLYYENKIKFDIDTVRYYYTQYGIDDTLALFINSNVAGIKNCTRDNYELDLEDESMLQKILSYNKISIPAACAILDNELLKKSFPKDWQALKTEVLSYAIDLGLIFYSLDNVQSIIKNHSALFVKYTEKYANDIISTISELTLSVDTIKQLINLPKFRQHKIDLVNTISESSIVSASDADFYIAFVADNKDFPMNKKSFNKAIGTSKNIALKVKAINNILSNKLIHPSELANYAESVNSNLGIINTPGQVLKFPNETYYEELIYTLNRMYVVGKIKKDETSLWAVIRTPRSK